MKNGMRSRVLVAQHAQLTPAAFRKAEEEINRMPVEDRLRHFEEVIASQPQLSGTILVLQRLGISLNTLNPLANFLQLIDVTLKQSGISLPAATEDEVDLCYERAASKIPSEPISRHQKVLTKSAIQLIDNHPEPWLLEQIGRASCRERV